MSSNTLRGIGQEEGGDDDVADPAPQGPIKGENRGEDEGGVVAAGEAGSSSSANPANSANSDRTERTAEPSAPSGERLQDVRKIRSLDATVPGTRSLDSSVPGAPPSLDGKVPALASTLLGVPAPVLGNASSGQVNREAGTVQGRDVHLPVEAQRRAAVRSVADGVAGPDEGRALHVEAAPQTVDLSEPTVADPVRTAALAQAAASGERVRGNTPVDLNSHGPWYEQDPTGGHPVYEEPKASVLGPAAIGVAVAAALSVVVFAVIRVSAANGGDRSRRAEAPSYAVPARPATGAPSPNAASSRSREAPAGTSERLPGDFPTAHSAPASDQAGTGADSTFDSSDLARPGARPMEGAAAARGKLPAPPRPVATRTTGPGPARVAPHSGRPNPGDPIAPRPPLSNDLAPPPLLAPPPQAATPPPFARPEAPSAVVPGAIFAKPPVPERTRGRPKDDPDSTLPLNID